MMLAMRDLYWLAGLMEGEGSFMVVRQMTRGRATYRPTMVVAMTDFEPVERVSQITESKIYRYFAKSGKCVYRVQACGRKAMEWMQTLYSLMSPRRQSQIRDCIAQFKINPGPGGGNKPRQQVQCAASLGYA